MEARKIRFASILLGLVMALSLMPSLAIAASLDPGAQNNATSNELKVANIEQPLITRGTKPQVIQANSMFVFKTDEGKKIGANVIEPASGGGALSYAVKEGSGDYVDVNTTTGELTFKKAGEATVIVTAAKTDTYAETSVEVPIKIYEQFEYEISFWTVQYAQYNRVYNLSSLDITLYKGNNVVGSTTVQDPRNGNKVTVSATDFADRVEMTAHIQLPRSAPITLTGTGGIGGAINVWNPNSRSGKVFTCNYGMNAPDPDYTAPVAKTNLTANGSNQTLIYPGSVSIGGAMQYKLGKADGPGDGDWIPAYGYMRVKDPGTYYVWWRTHNRDYYSAQYIGQGRSEITSQQPLVVTIGKGNINPEVNIEGWTYNEEPKAPTVSGNAGNGKVTYEYKVQGANDDTYTTNVPEDAGNYTVRATIAETTSYNGGSATADFTIAQAPMPLQNVHVAGRMDSVDDVGSNYHFETRIEQLSVANVIPEDAGVLRYQMVDPIPPTGVTVDSFTVGNDGFVNAHLEYVHENESVILPVTVESRNYIDATINIVVVPTARNLETVTIDDDVASKTYGDGTFDLTARVAGTETGENDWYWYSSNPSVLEVDTWNGSNNMTIRVKGAGSAQILAWYEPSDGNTYGMALTQFITVNKAAINPSVTINDWTYGDTANVPSVDGIPQSVLNEITNNTNISVTYEYKAKDAADGTYTTAVPKLAGEYTVRVTVPETTNYKGATCTANFAIAQKSITATVTAEDKTYDGTTVATVAATVPSTSLVAGDLDGAALVEDGKVTICGLAGTFADKNVGEDKAITLNYDGIISPVANAESYDVNATTTEPTASIKQRPIYIKADDKSSQYGQDIAALTFSPYGSTELAEGDTLESLGITASTTATSSSGLGEYPIKLSGGAANPNYDVTLGEGGGTYTITKASIAKATVATAAQTYTGKELKPAPTVTLGSTTLKADADYTVSYRDNIKAGTATAIVTGKGNYADSAIATFTIKKAANKLTVKTATKSVKVSKKTKKVKPFKKVKPRFTAKVTYKKATTAKAKKLNGYKVLTVNKKNGKATVKAGTKPGIYKLMVKVTAAKTANTKAVSKTVTVKVKVKS